MTNAQFAQENKLFLRICGKANFDPLRAQASKWRRKMGFVWAVYTGRLNPIPRKD